MPEIHQNYTRRITRAAANHQTVMRITRAAAKRMAYMADEVLVITKKRVLLRELRNLSNVIVTVKTSKKRRKANKVAITDEKKKTLLEVEGSEPSVDFESRDIDSHYVSDIYAYLRELEEKPKNRPLPNYIEKIQKNLTPNMREALMDWLVEVAEEYKLNSETLFLSVSYVDRFLSTKTIDRQRLQLVGVSAMLIASKYEEMSPPKVDDFCYITDNSVAKQDVLMMESDMLVALQFELGSPTISTFLRRFTRVAQEDFKESQSQIEFLCCYLSELSMLEYTCLKFLPSLLAASSVFLARFIIRPKQHPWNKMLEEYTKYKAPDLQQSVEIIHDLYLSRRGNGIEAVRSKYKQPKFEFVAIMPVSPELPLPLFEDVHH